MKTMLFAAGLIAAATAAAAQVAPTAPRDGVQTRAEAVERVRTMFARADGDRDGFLTQADRQAMAGKMAERRQGRAADPARGQKMFERLDTNRDNMISRQEFDQAQAMRGERGARQGQRMAMRGQRMAMRGMRMSMLRQADANRDQRISLAEAEAAALQRFDRVDANRDGRITQEERQQQRQMRRATAAPTPAR